MGEDKSSMNKRDFLKKLAALGVVPLLPTKIKEDGEEHNLKNDDNVVLMQVKVDGKVYALGYRLTGTVNDYRALTWLSYASEMRLRQLRNDIPDRSFKSRPHRSLDLPEIKEK
jgi:hypothetical protein